VTERKILHVDMDAFYAAVEVLDDPSLAGRPVIVGGTPAGRGVVAAASYEARRFGVHSAMPAARARQLCPTGVFRRPRMQRYVDVSGQILAILQEYTPLVEPLSIDEAFLDVTGCERLFGSATAIGRTIKDRLRREVGLTASVGVAPNKFLAKLASDLEKPDGFVVIEAADARDRLAALPVRKLWGVGEVSERELRGHGIRTIGELASAPRSLLAGCFGEHAGQLLDLAAGRDDRPVVPAHEAKSIGNEVTFAADIADPEELRGVLDLLAEKVAWRLRRHGLRGRTVTVKARFPDFATHTRSETLPQTTCSTATIRAVARELLERRLDRRGRPLRLVGVTVSQLAGRAAVQGELFSDPAGVRDAALDRLVDRVRDRFGPLLRRGGR
jgi:DNA polymerase-4